jgi:hypothetical protein
LFDHRCWQKLLKRKGVDAATVDGVYGLHALRMLGIKQGVLRGSEEEQEAVSSEEEEEEEEVAAAPPAYKPPAGPTDLPLMYRNAIDEDEQLRDMDINSMAELHSAMAQLSAEMEEDRDGSFWKQITFSGKHPYPLFEPNRIHKHVGCDSGTVKIIDYYRYAKCHSLYLIIRQS